MTDSPLMPWDPGFQEDAFGKAADTPTEAADAPVAPSAPVTAPSAPVTAPSAPAPSVTSVSGDKGNVVIPAPAGVDVQGLVQDAVDKLTAEAQSKLTPELQAKAEAYAKAYVSALIKGQATPSLPSLGSLAASSVTLPDGEEFKLKDAKNRAFRTFVQGLSIDAFGAVLAIILAVVGGTQHVDLLTQAGWTTLGALVLKTLAQTTISYISRVKLSSPQYQQDAVSTLNS